MEVVQEIISVILMMLVCAIKFLTGPLVVLAAGYNTWQTILIAFVGGVAGCWFFFFMGGRFFTWWEMKFGKRNRRRFTKKNRFIVRFKNKFGMPGVAGLTALISIPVTCFIAAKYFRGSKQAMPSFIAWIAFYSIFLTLFSNRIIALFKTVL